MVKGGSMEPKKSGRIAGLDLLKTIAIFMVICIHVPLTQTNFMETGRIGKCVQYAIRLAIECVPIFVFVNGFLLFGKRSFDIKAHVHKMVKMLVLLLIWCGIYVVLYACMWGEPITLHNIIKYTLTMEVGYLPTGLLWYLRNLLMLYILFPVLKFLYDEKQELFKYMFAVVAFFSVGLNFIELLTQLYYQFGTSENVQYIYTFIVRYNPLTNTTLLFYFMAGGMAIKHVEQLKQIKVIVLGVIAWGLAFAYGFVMSKLSGVTYNEGFNYSTIFLFFIILALFSISLRYEDKGKWYKRLIQTIGANTLGIYLIHIFVINFVGIFIPNERILQRCSIVLLSFVLSVVLVVIIRKIPILKKLMEM